MSRCRRKYVDLGHRSAAGNKAGHNLPSALRCKLLRVQRRLVALLATLNFAPVATLLAILNVVPNIAAAGASLVARRVCPPMDYSRFPGGDFPNTFVVADREDLNKLCRQLGLRPRGMWRTVGGFKCRNRDALAIYLARLRSADNLHRLVRLLGDGAGSAPRISAIFRSFGEWLYATHGHRVQWSHECTTPANMAACKAAAVAAGSMIPDLVGFIDGTVHVSSCLPPSAS